MVSQTECTADAGIVSQFGDGQSGTYAGTEGLLPEGFFCAFQENISRPAYTATQNDNLRVADAAENRQEISHIGEVGIKYG